MELVNCLLCMTSSLATLAFLTAGLVTRSLSAAVPYPLISAAAALSFAPYTKTAKASLASVADCV